MRALLSIEPGGPEALRLEDLPDPAPGAGELLVRVRACAINYPDVLIIEDKYRLKPPRPFALRAARSPAGSMCQRNRRQLTRIYLSGGPAGLTTSDY